MRRRRNTDVFSLSFLDCMSCGFGAVILFFMIINATVSEQTDQETVEEMSEVSRVEEEVLEGRKDLVVVRNSLDEVRDELTITDGETAQVLAELQELRERLAEFDDKSLARRESVEDLQADVRQLEEAKRRLQAASVSEGAAGSSVRAYTGDGSRQYLTGLRVRGERTLILVDSSASMLDETIVNIIRRRNMPVEQQLRAAKWRQVVSSVDWISSQLQPETQFQIYRFNERAEPVIEGSEGIWLDVGDGLQLDQAIETLRTTPPSGGTNLHDAFSVVRSLSPRPDNILLLIDSLPTLGENPPARAKIDAKQRVQLFGQAVRQLPSGIPVNILLYPMEGDFYAPIEYWKLAFRSGGSFISVSDDWP
jgi:hypothetical protein